jgi:hypothetical protein
MGNENITWYHGGLGTHWTISVVAGVSGAPPSLPRGAGLLKGLLLTLLTPAVGAGYQQLRYATSTLEVLKPLSSWT